MEKLNNIESPFAELFSLLKRYENSSTGSPVMNRTSDELINIDEWDKKCQLLK